MRVSDRDCCSVPASATPRRDLGTTRRRRGLGLGSYIIDIYPQRQNRFAGESRIARTRKTSTVADDGTF